MIVSRKPTQEWTLGRRAAWHSTSLHQNRRQVAQHANLAAISLMTIARTPERCGLEAKQQGGGRVVDAAGSSSHDVTDTASCESLRLQLVELGLGDRSRVEELFGRCDLIGAGAATARRDN
jgi:hypothetical protein